MADITLSAGVRQNLLSLQKTADLMATTQNRLATGKKVNSALDNPTNFFTSQSLQTRSKDLSSLLDAMSNGIKTLEAADNGLTAITKTLESMQSTLSQARQDKSYQATSYSIGLGASPAGTEQLSISGGAVGATAVDIDLTTAGAGTAGTNTATYAADATAFTAETAATAGAVTATFGSALTFDNPGDQLNFTIAIDGGSTASVTIDATVAGTVGNNDAVIDDIAELQAAITSVIDTEGTYASGVDYTISNDGTDITIESATTGTTSSVALSAVGVVDGGGGDTLANTSGLADGSNSGAALIPADAISFDIAVDGGTPTTVTIDQATVAGVGNNDNVIDSIVEFQAAIEAGLTAAGVTGVTLGNDGTDITFTSDTTGTSSSVVISNATANSDGGGNANTLYGLVDGTGTAGTGTTANVAKTVDVLVAEINNNANLTGKVRASNDNGSLRLENQSTTDLDLVGVTASTGTIDGSTGTGTIGGNTVRAGLATQFNELRDQLDKLAGDSSFNGINLLNGDNLKITFNETGSSAINIQTSGGAAVDSAFLNISSIVAADLDADTNIDTTIDTVKAALGTIRSQSSSFGSNLSIVQNRTEFTNAMRNTLETGADNLVLADGNEEAANMLALQTRQQLASTALSLASQADQAVLRLF